MSETNIEKIIEGMQNKSANYSKDFNIGLRINICLNDYIRWINSKSVTVLGFMKKLKAYCLVSPSVKRLNRDEFKNLEGRVIRKVEDKTYETLYVQTTDEIDFFEITQKLATEASNSDFILRAVLNYAHFG
jgi:hypothetical protein